MAHHPTDGMRPLRPLTALSLGVLIAGCGGGGASVGPSSGTLSVAVADAPIDDANSVTVTFSAVTLQPQDGDRIEILLDQENTVDFLALGPGESVPLLEDASVPSGAYNFMRLEVVEDETFIELADGSEHPLVVPSARGLQLSSGFTVTAGGESDFTIDFNLRKAITDPPGRLGFLLRPSLRLVDNAEVGTLAGMVAAGLVMAPGCDADDDPGEFDDGNAVYVYEGAGATADDVGSADEPLTTSLVEMDTGGEFTYSVGFLPAGDYTVAFTCLGGDDDPDADDDVPLVEPTGVTIRAGETTTQDLPSP